MQIDTNIQNNLTSDEKEIFSIIRKVIEKYTPSTNAFAVGGWTRDKLIGTPSDDIDIMLDNISGEDFAKLITKYLNIKDPHIIRENPEKSKHITTAKAYIPLSSGNIQEIDFAQARTETYSEDSRIPDIKPATPQEDAQRRDLTINSMFYHINNNQIVDYTGKGLKDIVTDTIRTPTDPLKTFSDDPLRIFRVIRFAAKYNGNIDSETYQAMQDSSLRNEIKQKISKERIGIEITKMLKNPNPEIAMKLLKDTGLWQDIITEALKGTKYETKMSPLEMEQQNVHHKLNLWDHTMQVVKNVLDKYKESEPEKRIVMILGALMHDIGKLYIDIQKPSKSVPGSLSYIGHEKESREIAEHILKYLKMEPYIQQVGGLARHHMRPHTFTEQDASGLRAMRRFIRQMGEKSLNWLDVFNLAVADAYAKDVIPDPERIQAYQELENQLQEALISLKPIEETIIPPILDGNEVMEILNVKPGPWMKDMMEFVKELKDENPDITKDEAAEKLREKYQNMSQENIRETQAKKKEKEMDSVCPNSLLKKRTEQMNNAFKNKKYYEAATLIKELKEDYGNDDRITRLAAITMFKLLLKNEKYRDNNFLDYIFHKAEANFFDTILCPYAVGILLLIETATEDDIVKEVGTRMAKMSPGTLRTVLDMLPKDIDRPNLKKEFEKMLK